MKQALIIGTLMLAMAVAPAASAEITDSSSRDDAAVTYALPCNDFTPPGAFADCVVELGLSTAIDTVQLACRTAGYSC
jgi:hypothetical protein